MYLEAVVILVQVHQIKKSKEVVDGNRNCSFPRLWLKMKVKRYEDKVVTGSP
jgi:hypothetical protein